MNPLESRYRRLLALLPWEHRRRYEQEMLGVLLDGAAEGQRRPRPAETADLLATAVRLRLRGTVRRLGDRHWADAFAAVGVLVAIALATAGVRRIGLVSGVGYLYGEVVPTFGPSDAVRIGVWTLAAVAARTGWRWAAAVLAAAGALVELAMFVRVHGADPDLAALPVGAALAAAGALTVAAVRGSTFRLGRAPLSCALAAGAAAVAAPLSALVLGPGRYVSVLGRPLSMWSAAAWALTGILAAAAVVTLAPPVRRRAAAVLTAPVAVLAVTWVDPYSMAYGGRIYQVVALLVVPTAAVLLGVVLVHRHEERSRLIDLGRRADV